MREILFRGMCCNNCEWVEGDLLSNGIDYRAAIRETGTRAVIAVDPATVGQYTGLTDKNGKKIFEGDIVREDSGDTRLLPDIRKKERTHLGVVRFGKHEVPADDPFEWGDAYGFFIEGDVFTPAISCYGDGHRFSLEVVGNIHDNPAMLKGGTKE